MMIIKMESVNVLHWILSNETGAKLEVLGLDDRTAGFDKKVDNLPPDKYAIEKKVIEILERKVNDS